MLLTPKAFVESFSKESTLGSYLQTTKIAQALKQKGYTGEVIVGSSGVNRLSWRPDMDYYHHFFAIEVTECKFVLWEERKTVVDTILEVIREHVTEDEPRHKNDYHTRDYRLLNGAILKNIVCFGTYLPVMGLMPHNSIIVSF